MSIPAPPKQSKFHVIELLHEICRNNEGHRLSGLRYEYQSPVRVLYSTNVLSDAIVFLQGVVSKLEESSGKYQKILEGDRSVLIVDRSKGWITTENKVLFTYTIDEKQD